MIPTYQVGGPVYHRYICDHCGQDSGRIQGIRVIGESDRPTAQSRGSSIVYEATHEELMNSAKKNFNIQLSIRKEEVNNGNYCNFLGKCPHCGKHQSWEKKGYSWWNILDWASLKFIKSVFYCAIGGVVVFFAVGILGGGEYVQTAGFWVFVLIISIIIALIVTIRDIVIDRNNRINIQKDTKNILQKSKPEIEWPSA